MKEAIEEMSGKGFGMTTVVDAAGRLVGVVTDSEPAAPAARPRGRAARAPGRGVHDRAAKVIGATSSPRRPSR